MKRTILIALVMMICVAIQAQENKPKFSKEAFKADLKAFIIKDAKLTKAEADKFFPVYDEMKKEQRKVYGQMRALGKSKPQSEEECVKAIKKHDELDLQLKKIQQTYNNRMMKIIPASKLFDVIKAEDRFHRKALDKFHRGQKQKRK